MEIDFILVNIKEEIEKLIKQYEELCPISVVSTEDVYWEGFKNGASIVTNAILLDLKKILILIEEPEKEEESNNDLEQVNKFFYDNIKYTNNHKNVLQTILTELPYEYYIIYYIKGDKLVIGNNYIVNDELRNIIKEDLLSFHLTGKTIHIENKGEIIDESKQHI